MIIKKSDKWIPWYFVFFFMVITAVDTAFVTTAIRTQTGVVADRAYEKGLAYDKTLDEAAAQSRLGINQKATFKDGILSWKLMIKDGHALEGAHIAAHFFRPTQDGYDFDMILSDKGSGLYQARPQFPLPGLWIARLEAQWLGARSEKLQYKTTLEFQNR